MQYQDLHVSKNISALQSSRLSLVVVALFVIVGVFLHFLPSLNKWLFVFINSIFPNPNFWLAITTLGDGAVAGCLFYLLFRKRNDVLAKGLIGAVIGLAASEGLKRLFAIFRPEHTIGFGDFHLLADSMAATNYSMPSGHVITALLLGTFLFQYLKLNVVVKVVLVIILLLIAVSRIALGVHWPADVFVGAGLGIIIAVMCGLLPMTIKNGWQKLTVHILYLPFLLYGIFKYF